jgi:hypothetical protein
VTAQFDLGATAARPLVVPPAGWARLHIVTSL